MISGHDNSLLLIEDTALEARATHGPDRAFVRGCSISGASCRMLLRDSCSLLWSGRLKHLHGDGFSSGLGHFFGFQLWNCRLRDGRYSWDRFDRSRRLFLGHLGLRGNLSHFLSFERGFGGLLVWNRSCGWRRLLLGWRRSRLCEQTCPSFL
jgi:hypothetical protein